MEQGTARDAWAGLDRQTRREVWRQAREGRVPDDPAVAGIAIRYGRAVLDGSRPEWALRSLATVPTLLCVLVVAMVVGFNKAGGALSGPDLAVNAVFAVLGIVSVIFAVRGWRRWDRFRLLTRMERASWNRPDAGTAVQAAVPVRETSAAGDRTSLAVRYDSRKAVRALGIQAAVTCAVVCGLLFEVFTQHGLDRTFFLAVLVAGGGVSVLAVGMQAWMLARWIRSGRPVLDLDDSGVHLNVVDLDVPWSAVSEIRLFPVRGGLGRGASGTLVGFICSDPAAVLNGARLSRTRRRMVRNATRIYGTPLTVADTMLDRSAAEISAAASGFAGAPVRRH